jgi:hypothetical protein
MEQKESGPKAAQQSLLAHNYYTKTQKRRNQIERIKAGVDYACFYRPEISGDIAETDPKSWVAGGICPFTNDCQSGEFEVNLQTGRCRCKSCESETDALGYLMQRRGLKFSDALHFLKEVG